MPRAKSLPRPVAVRWLVRPGDRVHGCGAVEINGRWYFVEPCHADDFALPPVLTGYRLTRLDTGEAHGIDLQYLTCDCPDALYRKRECKHLRAVKEILP